MAARIESGLQYAATPCYREDSKTTVPQNDSGAERSCCACCWEAGTDAEHAGAQAWLAHAGHWSTYAPPLGPMIEGANMRTIAGYQRRLVASHIVYLQHVLAEYRLQKNTKLP